MSKLLLAITTLSLQVLPIHGMQKSNNLSLEDRYKNAVSENDVQGVKDCLEQGIPLNIVFKTTHSALSTALREVRFNVASFLLQQKDIQVNGMYGHETRLTPLQWVLENTHHGYGYFTPEQKLLLTKLLLQRGADVAVKRWGDQTPLHCALQNNKHPVSITELFVAAGARMEKDKYGDTPLMSSQRDPLPAHARILLKSSHISIADVERVLKKSLYDYSADLITCLSQEAHACVGDLSSGADRLQSLKDEVLRGNKKVQMPIKKLTVAYNKIEDFILHLEELAMFKSMVELQAVNLGNFDKLRTKFELLTKRKQFHTIVSRYYKVRYLLERAQRPFWLPADVVKMIAYESTKD